MHSAKNTTYLRENDDHRSSSLYVEYKANGKVFSIQVIDRAWDVAASPLLSCYPTLVKDASFLNVMEVLQELIKSNPEDLSKC